MLSLDDHPRSGSDDTSLAEEICNLRGETLLDLRPAGKHLYEPRDFAATENPALGNIADVSDPMEWQKMMFTQRCEGDVSHNDHLMVVLIIETCFKQLTGILCQAGKKLFVHLGDAPRRADQPLARGVFANRIDNHANGLLDALLVHCGPPPSSILQRPGHWRETGIRRKIPSCASRAPWFVRHVPAACWPPAQRRTRPRPLSPPRDHRGASAAGPGCSPCGMSPRKSEGPNCAVLAIDASARDHGQDVCRS